MILRTLCGFVTVLGVLGSNVFAQENAAPSNNPAPQPAPVVELRSIPSLVELVDEADRIVRGKVIGDEELRIDREGNRIEQGGLPIYQTTIQVQEVLKGDVGKQLIVRQVQTFVPPAARMKQGEEVLLYLDRPAKSLAKLGIASPIGLVGGQFRIKPDPAHPEGKIAENGFGNAGLFPADSPLVAEGSELKATLQQKIEEELEGSAKLRASSALANASPASAEPLPIELLEITSRALLRNDRR